MCLLEARCLHLQRPGRFLSHWGNFVTTTHFLAFKYFNKEHVDMILFSSRSHKSRLCLEGVLGNTLNNFSFYSLPGLLVFNLRHVNIKW